jgi:hypothetical protein
MIKHLEATRTLYGDRWYQRGTGGKRYLYHRPVLFKMDGPRCTVYDTDGVVFVYSRTGRDPVKNGLALMRVSDG